MRCMNTCASTDGARRAQNCAMFASVCVVVFMPLFAMCSSMFKLCVRMYAGCRSHLCIVNVREYEVQDTFPLHNIQNRSSTRAPQFSTSQSDWDETDLPNSLCTDVSCCLPARISRVPYLRIQSCSLEINLAAVYTCLMSKFLRHVYCCHFH